tara:strand:+ start:6330 stop:6641 length:312 start_codon:yes stop_codon:yes gene_type:complete
MVNTTDYVEGQPNLVLISCQVDNFVFDYGIHEVVTSKDGKDIEKYTAAYRLTGGTYTELGRWNQISFEKLAIRIGKDAEDQVLRKFKSNNGIVRPRSEVSEPS